MFFVLTEELSWTGCSGALTLLVPRNVLSCFKLAWNDSMVFKQKIHSSQVIQKIHAITLILPTFTRWIWITKLEKIFSHPTTSPPDNYPPLCQDRAFCSGVAQPRVNRLLDSLPPSDHFLGSQKKAKRRESFQLMSRRNKGPESSANWSQTWWDRNGHS